MVKNLLEERSQAEPRFQSKKIFTRMTSESFRKELAEQLQRTAGVEWWSVGIVPHPCIQ